MILKSLSNPILVADPSLKWANRKVYNAAAFFNSAGMHLYFRAIGEDYISRIGHATGMDGEHFRIHQDPVFLPIEPWESKGCEDPRITKIGELYVMAYTAFDGINARVALTTSNDCLQWSKRILALPSWQTPRWIASSGQIWNKGAALFPERIGGKFHMFFGDENIWQATSEDLMTWTPVLQPVFEPRIDHFDSNYIEMGPPPIRVTEGWLILYHGIEGEHNARIYRIGAAIVDYEDPSKILWRCNMPLLEPTELFERVGHIDIVDGGMQGLENASVEDLTHMSVIGELPQAIFWCGAIEKNNSLHIYYSGSDTVLCMATATLDDIRAC